MGIRRTWSDVKQMRLLLSQLLRQGDDKEAASWEIASSARRFAHRTKSVVDDKLTLSATLMRAGEVHEASKLLAEVERDVRTEEAALIERVNEVKVAQAIRRDRLTRTRLAGTLAAALLGSSLLAFSAVGVSLASMLGSKANPVAVDDDAPTARPSAMAKARQPGAGNRFRREHEVRIGGVKVALSSHQLDVYRALTSGNVDAATLQQFLYRILPTAVADKVLAAASAPVQQAAELLQRTAQKINKKKRPQQNQAQDPQPADEPSPQPSPSDDDQDDDPADDPSDAGKKKNKEDPNRLPLPISANND